MAEVKLSTADMEQQYYRNLVAYKGVPIYVESILNQDTIRAFFLEEQKSKDVPFNLKDVTVLRTELGMLNVRNSAFFTCRIPVRKMNIGIDRYNFNVQLVGPMSPQETDETLRISGRLHTKELLKTIKKDYPSFKQASEKAKEHSGCCAFDRQFAIDYIGNVYYKTRIVGFCNGSKISEIKWQESCEYLEILLERNYEKTVRIVCPA